MHAVVYEKKIWLIQLNGNIEYFLIKSIKYLFTTIKISIWIQWNVSLNCNEKILSISNKSLFERHF